MTAEMKFYFVRFMCAKQLLSIYEDYHHVHRKKRKSRENQKPCIKTSLIVILQLCVSNE